MPLKYAITIPVKQWRWRLAPPPLLSEINTYVFFFYLNRHIVI